MSTVEFMKSLKQFIARRGKPEKIYSDNAKTFITVVRRIQKTSKRKEVNNLLEKTWHDSSTLAKDPLVGQVNRRAYRRGVRLVSEAMHMHGQGAKLVLDVQICLDNRPV